MFNKYLFYQNNYEKENNNLAKYGCFFLTLCFISQQEKDPRVLLKTKEDILRIAKEFQEKGYLDKDFFVNDASHILKELTGKASRQLSLNTKFGVMGKETYFPILYPMEKGTYEVICYRNKDNMDLTHFSLGKTKRGNTQEAQILFNTLGEKWLTEKENLWFACDKRAFKVG